MNATYRLFSVSALIFFSFHIYAQKKDSLAKNNSKLRSYKEIITDRTISQNGLIKIHQTEDKYYFEIDTSLLEKDFLIVNRIAKAAAENYSKTALLGFGGDELDKNIVRFKTGPKNKIYVEAQSYVFRTSDSTSDGLLQALTNSNIFPIVASFDIMAYGKDSSSVIIDVTNFLEGDNNIFTLGSFSTVNFKKSALGLGAFQNDKSYIKEIKAYSTNVEIRTVKTYQGRADFVTYELNTSIIQLPNNPMEIRKANKKVGYFTVSYYDYSSNSHNAQIINIIKRWRLEPRKDQVVNYLKGELVEPQKPIIFYIDPATPKKWIKYLIQGVEDWQTAFEQAGFKNAIRAIEVPDNDSTWSMEDAKHNVIVYKASLIENASGPVSIVDPRSGEMLETHINWHHNIQKLLHDWYFIQVAPNDPSARYKTFNDTLMGKLIRYVISHEVGHTLGLLHNFGASSTYPTDSLRNRSWVEKNGFTPSIMDYSRFNYVAQPEDALKEDCLIPKIGVYDKWAIEFGYKWFNNNKQSTPCIDSIINDLVDQKTKSDKKLWFGNEMISNDPRIQAEDIGDNAIKSSYLGIQNLKLLSNNLLHWTLKEGDDIDYFSDMRDAIIRQFNRYVSHVALNIGGRYMNLENYEKQTNTFSYVSKERQIESLKFINEQLFITPDWILMKQYYTLQGGAPGMNAVMEIQKNILSKFISSPMYYSFSFSQFTANPYLYKDFLTDLKNYIFSELNKNIPTTVFRRNLQKIYIEELISNLNGSSTTLLSSSRFSSWDYKTDFISILRYNAIEIKRMISTKLNTVTDISSKSHFEDILSRLKKALE